MIGHAVSSSKSSFNRSLRLLFDADDTMEFVVFDGEVSLMVAGNDFFDYLVSYQSPSHTPPFSLATSTLTQCRESRQPYTHGRLSSTYKNNNKEQTTRETKERVRRVQYASTRPTTCCELPPLPPAPHCPY